MARLSASIALAALALVSPVAAADLDARVPAGRFRATCEDLGGICFADACGRDQIEAAENCRLLCPSAAVLGVVPAACRVPALRPDVVLRRRG